MFLVNHSKYKWIQQIWNTIEFSLFPSGFQYNYGNTLTVYDGYSDLVEEIMQWNFGDSIDRNWYTSQGNAMFVTYVSSYQYSSLSPGNLPLFSDSLIYKASLFYKETGVNFVQRILHLRCVLK